MALSSFGSTVVHMMKLYHILGSKALIYSCYQCWTVHAFLIPIFPTGEADFSSDGHNPPVTPSMSQLWKWFAITYSCSIYWVWNSFFPQSPNFIIGSTVKTLSIVCQIIITVSWNLTTVFAKYSSKKLNFMWIKNSTVKFKKCARKIALYRNKIILAKIFIAECVL